MLKSAKPEEKTFDTIDVIAIYLGKTLRHGQLENVQKIMNFLLGPVSTFSSQIGDNAHILQPVLAKQHEWLRALRYPGKAKADEWLQNIIRNHGEKLTLSK